MDAAWVGIFGECFIGREQVITWSLDCCLWKTTNIKNKTTERMRCICKILLCSLVCYQIVFDES